MSPLGNELAVASRVCALAIAIAFKGYRKWGRYIALPILNNPMVALAAARAEAKEFF
jgi:hypothetical protein